MEYYGHNECHHVHITSSYRHDTSSRPERSMQSVNRPSFSLARRCPVVQQQQWLASHYTAAPVTGIWLSPAPPHVRIALRRVAEQRSQPPPKAKTAKGEGDASAQGQEEVIRCRAWYTPTGYACVPTPDEYADHNIQLQLKAKCHHVTLPEIIRTRRRCPSACSFTGARHELHGLLFHERVRSVFADEIMLTVNT
jgi:hypothetical protein